MGIEEDIDYVLKEVDHHEKKANIAYGILDRFDQVKAELEIGREDMDIFTWAKFIPPTLRQIVDDYISNKYSKKKTLQRIMDTRTTADTYLKQHGYDADLLFEEERNKIDRLDAEIKILEEENKELNYLSETVGKISRLMSTGKKRDINKAMKLIRELDELSENSKNKKPKKR